MLKGEILLNLDTEEDDELDIGCAGGVDVSATKKYTEENIPANSLAFHITVKGLNGGHSGMDIHKGLGNANKIMNRLLWDGYENFGLRISKIEGGGLRNAIPRESNAWIVISTEKETTFLENIHLKTQEITLEYQSLEPNLQIVIQKCESPLKVMDVTTQEQLIKAIYAAHNGVFRMSPAIDDLVEASNNVARVEVGNGQIAVHNLTRSSVESSKLDVANQLKATFELMGATVEFSGSYPGWSPNAHSPILETMSNLYEKMFAEKPKVMACHAGLECGILGTNYPTMDMISFGPTIQGAHSPDEKVCISSVQKFWKFLLETLKNIPSK
jgi:dipeptidase D